MSLILLLTRMQYVVYFASLWPFLKSVDPSASPSFYGFMTAAYSIGVALSSPFFGMWSNRMKELKVPALFGMAVMIASNLCYIFVEFAPLLYRRYVLLTARSATGISAGVMTLMYTYPVISSSLSDKSTAAAFADGALSLGTAFGPFFQVAFAPLGYPGIYFGPMSISMCTGPAYAACIAVLLAALLMVFQFRENTSIFVEKMRDEGVSKDVNPVLPKYNRTAAALCMVIKFVQMFVYANIETYVLGV
ncbi:hypothetical protein AB6A40_008065 [Gnathostoma spinigerum]|uniref:Major facilitator superfamily (MFS) profile domain-containing protein n=1 Tax=Gnathostoma spinigerum TaxID=75299 RepID=A0ABD6EV66_9BILA